MKKIKIHSYNWSFKEGGLYRRLIVDRSKWYKLGRIDVLIIYEKD